MFPPAKSKRTLARGVWKQRQQYINSPQLEQTALNPAWRREAVAADLRRKGLGSHVGNLHRHYKCGNPNFPQEPTHCTLRLTSVSRIPGPSPSTPSVARKQRLCRTPQMNQNSTHGWPRKDGTPEKSIGKITCRPRPHSSGGQSHRTTCRTRGSGQHSDCRTVLRQLSICHTAHLPDGWNPLPELVACRVLVRHFLKLCFAILYSGSGFSPGRKLQ